jgi:hypothetical protein
MQIIRTLGSLTLSLVLVSCMPSLHNLLPARSQPGLDNSATTFDQMSEDQRFQVYTELMGLLDKPSSARSLHLPKERPLSQAMIDEVEAALGRERAAIRFKYRMSEQQESLLYQEARQKGWKAPWQ